MKKQKQTDLLSHADFMKLASELEDYAEMCNDEFGEYCSVLVAVAYRQDFASDKFLKVLQKEIRDTLNYIKQNTTIVKHQREIQIEEYDELVWNL